MTAPPRAPLRHAFGLCLVAALPPACLAREPGSWLAPGLLACGLFLAAALVLRQGTERGASGTCLLAVTAATMLAPLLAALRPDVAWWTDGSLPLAVASTVLLLRELQGRPDPLGARERLWPAAETGLLFLAALFALCWLKETLGPARGATLVHGARVQLVFLLQPGGVMLAAGLLAAWLDRGAAEGPQ